MHVLVALAQWLRYWVGTQNSKVPSSQVKSHGSVGGCFIHQHLQKHVVITFSFYKRPGGTLIFND